MTLRCILKSQKIEQVQYSAALAVTGTWSGTSRQWLYEELCWKTLYHRRWYRRLTHLLSLKRSKLPEYLFNAIQQQCQFTHNLRNPSAYEQPMARTVLFSDTHFQNSLFKGICLTAKSKILLQPHILKRHCSQLSTS